MTLKRPGIPPYYILLLWQAYRSYSKFTERVEFIAFYGIGYMINYAYNKSTYDVKINWSNLRAHDKGVGEYLCIVQAPNNIYFFVIDFSTKKVYLNLHEGSNSYTGDASTFSFKFSLAKNSDGTETLFFDYVFKKTA